MTLKEIEENTDEKHIGKVMRQSPNMKGAC